MLNHSVPRTIAMAAARALAALARLGGRCFGCRFRALFLLFLVSLCFLCCFFEDVKRS